MPSYSHIEYIYIRIIMPPSSRKRNKGKDRKAKQQAKKEENDRLGANRLWRTRETSIPVGTNGWIKASCDHGCTVAISDDHPVSSFMDQFFINAQRQRKNMSVKENLREIFKSHPKIWNNEDYMKLVLAILARIGTNILLGEGSEMSLATYAAQSIVALEHYNGTDDIDSVINSQVVVSKWENLRISSSSSRRDCLKFYRKRSSCKCLKKMHLEARKTIPKMGLCWNCDKEMKRVSLSTCSRCMVIQYCSRECQVDDWPAHERHCVTLASARKKELEDQDG